jgi:hypothetical protein
MVIELVVGSAVCALGDLASLEHGPIIRFLNTRGLCFTDLPSMSASADYAPFPETFSRHGRSKAYSLTDTCSEHVCSHSRSGLFGRIPTFTKIDPEFTPTMSSIPVHAIAWINFKVLMNVRNPSIF